MKSSILDSPKGRIKNLDCFEVYQRSETGNIATVKNIRQLIDDSKHLIEDLETDKNQQRNNMPDLGHSKDLSPHINLLREKHQNIKELAVQKFRSSQDLRDSKGEGTRSKIFR